MTRTRAAVDIPDELAPTSQPRPAKTWWVLAWVALGALTGVLAIGGGDYRSVTRELPVTALGVAVLSYLAAAVFGRRWIGWFAAGIFSILVVLAEVVDVPRLAIFLTAAVVLATIGLIIRPRLTLPQTLAMVGYLGVGIVSLLLLPRIGLAVAGVVFAAHAVWDVIHYRRDAVVNRSLALWCIGLDVVVGVTCVAVAMAG